MPPMKVHLGIHLRFAADVHNSTSTCVVQLVIHLCFAADVHISWLDSRSANVSPTRQAFWVCRGGTHKLARFEECNGLLWWSLGAIYTTLGRPRELSGSLVARFGSILVALQGLLGALCWRGACSGGYLVCLFAFM